MMALGVVVDCAPEPADEIRGTLLMTGVFMMALGVGVDCAPELTLDMPSVASPADSSTACFVHSILVGVTLVEVLLSLWPVTTSSSVTSA